MSNLDRAKVLRDYIKEEPEDPFNYYALALEIKDLNPNEAEELFNFLLTKHSNYLPVYFHAAQFFFELNQIIHAKEIYENGIALAEMHKEDKTKKELQNAYQNFLFETDLD